MTVLASDPFVTAEQAALHGVELIAFDALVERSDVITVHVPLTRSTRGLIGRDQIARMRPGTILLNVARGGVLDEAAVAEGLASGRLGGAGIDVFENEPPTGSPLLEAPNTILTPHLGASTAEAQVLVAEEVADQVLEVLAGRSARYAVNAPLLTPETARALAPYLPLAELLGRFFAQFARGGVRTVTLDIAGELAAFDASPLTAAVLRGMIETSTTQRVNLVNAAAAGQGPRDHGRRAQDPRCRRVRRAVSLSGERARRADHRRGHRGRRRAPAHPPERLPSRHRADRGDAHHPPSRPAGMIGRIGQTLGAADVNISAMHVGRVSPRPTR